MARSLFQATVALVVGFAASAALAIPYTNFVVFGDSLSDPGNDYRITTTADPTKPFPPPPYFQGHFSNGITAAEYVASRSGLPTQNYAQGGATTGVFNIDDGRCIPTRDCLSPGNFQLQSGLLSGISTQVSQYLASGPANIGTTLFFLQGGANNFFAGGASVTTIVADLGSEVAALLGAGARHIVLSNVPNIARTPFGQSQAPADQIALAQGLALINGGIAQLWAAPQFQGAVIPLDAFGILNNVLDNASAFGFSNINGFCRGLASCNGYAFFDDVHPTTALHAIFGGGILAAAGIPEPSVLALFAIGVLGFALRRRIG
jgi:phospholipase/lecithinase/hemolysin